MKKVFNVKNPIAALAALGMEKVCRDFKHCHLEDVNIDSYFWTMTNGEQISIKEMSDKHLLNTINMLKTIIMEEQEDYDELNGIYDTDCEQ